MSTKSTPAFPVPLNPGECWNGMGPCDGMTLRDYFAGQAVSQIIATCALDTTPGMSKADYFAGRAYEIADAMLAARTQ